MSQGLKVGVLGTVGSPLHGYTVRALLAAGIPVEAVVLDQKRFTEKSLRIWHERTRGRLPILEDDPSARICLVESHNSDAMIELVQENQISLLINGGTMRILNSRVLSSTEYGVLNIHPGKLPAYRGCTCVEWAILRDDQIFNTVHLMDEGIDSGPVILQQGYVFTTNDDYCDVRVRVYQAGFDLLARAVSLIASGISMTKPPTQSEESGQYFEPIGNDQMTIVKEKLLAGSYKWQI